MKHLPASLDEKTAHLDHILESLQSVAIAFSGGTDSSFLAAAAFRVLKDNAVSVTAYSPTLAMEEQEDAARIAGLIGIRHVKLPVDEISDDGFRLNGADRCFHCKKLRFSLLSEWAEQQGIQWIVEGSNADDLNDYRPGMKAIESMKNVRSPLLESGLTKAEIRTLSRAWGLPTWNKPSAACLASRIAYGQPVTHDNLHQVDLAEKVVRRYAAGQVRVRHHGLIARIEVEPDEMIKLIDPEASKIIAKELHDIGFSFITLDLSGYRMGSLNETL